MSSPVYGALRAQRAITREGRFVFCSDTGAPLNHNNVTKRIRYPIPRHLGLERRRPYQTRHTAATLWLAVGESPAWLVRPPGHSSTEMLFRRYSRFVPNLTRRDDSAFEALVDHMWTTVRGLSDDENLTEAARVVGSSPEGDQAP